MLEVIAGIVVACAALALVLEPLVGSTRAAASDTPALDELDAEPLEESDSPKIRALLALREIEFDRATGKLSDEDYANLKAKYAAAAVAAIKTESEETPGEVVATTPGSLEDLAEAAVARARHQTRGLCPTCGPRPEPAARFCSRCGRILSNPDALPRCWICGGSIPEGSRYCPTCGAGLAA